MTVLLLYDPQSRPAHSPQLLNPFDLWLSLLCCPHHSGSAARGGSVLLSTEIPRGAFARSCLQRGSLTSKRSVLIYSVPPLLQTAGLPGCLWGCFYTVTYVRL